MLSVMFSALVLGADPSAMALPVLSFQDSASDDIPSIAQMEADGETPPVDVAPAGEGQEPAMAFDTSLSFDAGYTWQFKSSLDEGGRLAHGRFHTDGKVTVPVAKGFSMSLGWRYQLDHWTFQDVIAPWNNINTTQINLGFNWRIDDNWMILGGGQAMWAVEEGGDWKDGLIGGGLGAFAYTFSENFTLGGGVGVRSQLEDDALFYPIIILDWQITDRLSFDTRLTTGWANQSGAELVYELNENLDVGIAAVFDYERFRLDDSGPLPNGVGTTETLPLTFYFSWEPTEDVSLTFYAGATVYGRIKATNAASQDVYADNYKPAPVIGFQGAVRF